MGVSPWPFYLSSSICLAFSPFPGLSFLSLWLFRIRECIACPCFISLYSRFLIISVIKSVVNIVSMKMFLKIKLLFMLFIGVNFGKALFCVRRNAVHVHPLGCQIPVSKCGCPHSPNAPFFMAIPEPRNCPKIPQGTCMSIHSRYLF